MFLSTTTLPERHGSYYDPQWKLRFWAVGGVPDLAGLRQDWEDAPSISILVDRWTDNVYTNVQALCECSPKDIIRDLIIESDGALEWTLTPEEWLHVALGLSTGPLTSWEQAVGQSEDDSPLSQEGLFLGKLKRVELKQVNFRFHFDYMRDVFEDDEVGGDYPTISNGIHTLLKTSLSRRRAASDTRLTLFIRQCSIDSDQIRELQDIAEVDWDDVTDPAPTINEGGLD
ncbi:hypothetical protein EWM64_g7697 [Hericium alpestre]|uniref:Uncharacterized protein n=1 Tax=Hericium alpestre TaxID=135208 RepID=A0A4Y9ZNX8_9AGAM|nr:hypothetical protein EWM64_g7697 [Hericium alpestre]